MLTAAQHRVYRFIKSYFQDKGYAPTIAEIAKGLGLKSRSAMHRAIHAIAENGMIEIIPNKRRNIRLPEAELADEGGLPLLGAIAAGQPIEAVQEQQSINIGDKLLGPNRYALRVKGDSMIDEGIFDGDYVICEHADTAPDGAIVVALVENEEATLKTLKRNSDGTVSLIPANPTMQPMIYPADKVKVQGIFKGLLRCEV